MACDLYIAEPGNGKGYLLCEAAMRLLKQGRDVFVFLDGVDKHLDRWDALEPDPGHKLGSLHILTRDWLLNPANYPTFGVNNDVANEGGLTPGCVLIVEEAHLVYANPKELVKEDGEKPLDNRVVRFFRQHRHFARTLHDGRMLEMDILLDAQDLMALHPAIRRVTRKTYQPFNMVDRGMPNTIQLTKFNGARLTGARQSFIIRKDLSVHQYYDSVKGGSGAGVHKVDSQKRGGYIRWYHKAFLAIPVLLIGLLAWVGPKAYSVLTGKGASAAAVPGGAVNVSTALAAKPLCNGSGVILDLTGRRVFHKGVWADVTETAMGADGHAVWDVGPCRFRFGA